MSVAYESIYACFSRDVNDPFPRVYHLPSRSITFCIRQNNGSNHIDPCFCQKALSYLAERFTFTAHQFPSEEAERIHEIVKKKIALFENLTPDTVNHDFNLDLQRIEAEQRLWTHDLDTLLHTFDKLDLAPLNQYGTFLPRP